MLLIDNDAQRDLLTMDVCIDTLEAAFTALPQGRAVIRPKTDVYFPSAGEAGYFRFGSMEGAFDGIFAIRMTSDICQWDEVDGVMREEEYCIEPGTYCGLVLLFSSGTGAPLALLNDGFIQTMRVGGSAGLGAPNTSPARMPAALVLSVRAAWREPALRHSARCVPSSAPRSIARPRRTASDLPRRCRPSSALP